MTQPHLQPDFGYGDRDFPPLPMFLTPRTEEQAFTHTSLHGRPASRFEDDPDDFNVDYEKFVASRISACAFHTVIMLMMFNHAGLFLRRFEHLGDSVLQLHVTDLLRQMYPLLREGAASSIRAMVVGNDNLARISLRYRLPDRLRAQPAQLELLRRQTKVQADLFESVVGGLYHERGFEGLTRWMKQLFQPYLVAAYNLQREANSALALPSSPSSPIPVPSQAVMQYTAMFNQHFQKESRNYVHRKINSPTGQLWYVTLQVNGRLYGSGSGITLKAARNEAARMGLLSLGLIR
ncbi:hypothetical protein D9613_009440 [Agrocybe pediades]|uniref:Uncharacterized protein n=1 Tax=Agrocybe pediades TaxID=84607 RepID=A0A8H4R2M4_9AGAR|nr:hypothetical protein D9613_009440 [Agrocybe pediades]